MESASFRRQAMTFQTLPFKLAHGIFMKLFRKGQVWWVMALLGDSWCGISLLRWKAGWWAVAGPDTDTCMRVLTDSYIRLRLRPVHVQTHTFTHTDRGRSGQAPDWESHDVLIFLTMFSVRGFSSGCKKGCVQHHRQLHYTSELRSIAHQDNASWNIWIDFFICLVSLKSIIKVNILFISCLFMRSTSGERYINQTRIVRVKDEVTHSSWVN